MKLLIYETTHHETLPAILDMATHYFDEITVFLTETSYRNVCNRARPEDNWPGVFFLIQPGKCTNRNFIQKAFVLVKKEKYTHVHISTLDNNLLYFAAKIFSSGKINISLSVQAINEYCTLRFNGLRDFTESVAKLYFHKRIKHYRVFSPSMAGTLGQRFPASTPVFIPARFFSPTGLYDRKRDEFYKIVIPGSVDPNRRDYDFVLQFMGIFLPQVTGGKNIELVILGNSDDAYGKHVIAGLQTLESPHFTLKYYDGYISQAAYEQGLSNADIIWSPLQTKTTFKKTAEIYGITTATGLMADLLLNDIPALVPGDFNIPARYEDALIPYDSERQLMELMNGLMAEPGLVEDRRKRVREAFSFFAKENFTGDFEKLMGFQAP